jgi:hypothetical protein
VRKEKSDEKKVNVTTNTDLKNHAIPQNDNGTENETFSHRWSHGNNPYPGDVHIAGGLHRHSGLHPGGKEFSLLRSKNPICETAGWIAIL